MCSCSYSKWNFAPILVAKKQLNRPPGRRYSRPQLLRHRIAGGRHRRRTVYLSAEWDQYSLIINLRPPLSKPNSLLLGRESYNTVISSLRRDKTWDSGSNLYYMLTLDCIENELRTVSWCEFCFFLSFSIFWCWEHFRESETVPDCSLFQISRKLKSFCFSHAWNCFSLGKYLHNLYKKVTKTLKGPQNVVGFVAI